MLQSRILVGILLLCVSLAHAQELRLTPSHKDGIYKAGETVEWTVTVAPSTRPTTQSTQPSTRPTKLNYSVRAGGITEVAKGTVDRNELPTTITATLDSPNWLLAVIRDGEGQKDPRYLGGALIDPEKIQPSTPRPEDFDAFWESKIASLKELPGETKITPDDSGNANIDYFKVEIPNINDSKVYGQLAQPKKEGKFPAMLIVQWAGIYGLPKSYVVPKAQEGWLVFNIMAHDLPFDRDEAFYKNAAATTLKNYLHEGDTDREKSYFLRMYLGCYLGAEFLATHPQWDGKTLVVTGGSQGGMQALITAGLHPRISAALANIPAGADMTGPLAGRAAGFPYWLRAQKDSPDYDKMVKAAGYYDVVNFAPRINCPVLAAMGLLDETCPPSGIYAFMNQLKGEKEIIIMPFADHKGTIKNSQAKYHERSNVWLAAIKQGKPIPFQ